MMVGRRREGALKILLLLGSVLFALALGEISLRLLCDPSTALKWDDGEDFWKHIWMQGESIVLNNPRFIYSPTLGWRTQRNYRSEQFNTNSRGLRGRREYPYEKPAGERRIVVVGDSFTLGGRLIADDAVYTAVLERALPGVSVLNLGVAGYGIDQQLLYLREEGFKYNPDLVIVAIFVDDLRRAVLSFRDHAKPRFKLANGSLVLENVPVPSPETVARDISYRIPPFYVLALLEFTAEHFAREWVPLGRLEVDRLSQAILGKMREEAEQRAAKLLVLAIPDADFAQRMDRSERFLENWGRRTGTPVLMLREVFLAMPRDEQARLYDGHWTAFGHQVAAEAIRKTIVERKLLTEAQARHDGF